MGLCQSTRSTIDHEALARDLCRLCGSVSLSEDNLRGIIERHGVAPNNNDIPNNNYYRFLHWACRNERVTEGILRYLLEYFPNAVRYADENEIGRLPLHNICENKNVTLGMVQLLVDAYPKSLRHEDNTGMVPLHTLCGNYDLDDEVGLEILKLLIEKCPGALRHAARKGSLPLHLAAMTQSPEFCRTLIEAYPGSERMTTGTGKLPFHLACQYNTVATVKYLYQLHPESVHVATNNGAYPIQCTIILGLKNRSNLKDGIEVVKFLLDCNPDALSSTGETPLHVACGNENVTLNMVQLLIDAFPDSLRHEDDKGLMPLHTLCNNKNLDDEVAVDILKLLLERCPESVRHAARNGNLPIHIAARYHSPDFCRTLIETYPGSERMTNDSGDLPFHFVCQCNTVATAKYLYQLYPESINVADNDGWYPIHCTIFGLKNRKYSCKSYIEMVRFLLDCDPNAPLQMRQGKLPLYWVCNWATNDDTRKLNDYLKVLEILYDAYPEAIENNEITSNVDNFCQEVQTFIDIQLSFARQARDYALMTAPDENGQLRLHKALRENITLGSTKMITLGSIKLLVKGYPSAISCADNRGMLPLHVACQYHDSASVVEYLIGIDPTIVCTEDFEHNTALHHACCGAKYDTIALLLGKYGGISVSKRNADRQLPIDLLLQNKNEVVHKMGSPQVMHRERTHYTDSIFQLIRAYPEIVMRAASSF